MSRLIFPIFLVLVMVLTIKAQDTPFDIQLTPIQIEGVGGLQAFAFGQHEGKWLIVGGRLDGLHRRQPFASFDIAGHNTQLIVVDPSGNQSWTASLNVLPASIKEQLSATNMEFYQEGDVLYLIGGYGYSATAGDHITYPNLTAINIPQTIQAIQNDLSILPFIRQIKDDKLAVTGGYLQKIYDTYYLVGGQKFIGRYNPMGPNNGPGFIQEYTNAIRKFTLEDDGMTINIIHQTEIYDRAQLHRRDYNVAPQIMPNGREGLTAFSGVFQENVDLPFLTCVNIDSDGYAVQAGFNQYYNHYHCAHIPLYSAKDNEMHTLFFGGIAQYYDDNGLLVRDDNVPFVNTIARVTRQSDGSMAEYKLPITMPTLLGAGSEFIPNQDISTYENGVLKLDEIDQDTTMIGYIYGGISSSAPNIFFTNTGTQSQASSQIFKVFLIKSSSTSVHDVNVQSKNGLGMVIYPNPSDENINVNFDLPAASVVTLTIMDVDGKVLKEYDWGYLSSGAHHYNTTEVFDNHKILIFQLHSGDKVSIQKVVVR
ncbi:MAG TPA: hypothetical protein VK169_05370 [Saprospiraceae bacterium]|nr:hypothetical protein [Saprospiraceae bacterium]